MAKEKRFQRVYKQEGFIAGAEILVDTETGIQYLFYQSGNAGGLTPLLGSDGNPLRNPDAVE